MIARFAPHICTILFRNLKMYCVHHGSDSPLFRFVTQMSLQPIRVPLQHVGTHPHGSRSPHERVKIPFTDTAYCLLYVITPLVSVSCSLTKSGHRNENCNELNGTWFRNGDVLCVGRSNWVEAPIGRGSASTTDKDFSTSFKNLFQATKAHGLQQGHVLDDLCQVPSGIIENQVRYFEQPRLRGMSESRVRYSNQHRDQYNPSFS